VEGVVAVGKLQRVVIVGLDKDGQGKVLVLHGGNVKSRWHREKIVWENPEMTLLGYFEVHVVEWGRRAIGVKLEKS
jgi:hypothetical protein